MIRKILVATVVVFVVWAVLDFVLHGLILQGAYASTPVLWRPQAEMKMGVLWFSVLIGALGFCVIWTRMVAPKNPNTGLWYGLWWGIARGIGMGYGTFAVQPIPYVVAISWFLGCVVEAVIAGLIVAALVKE